MPLPKVPLRLLGQLERYHLWWWSRQIRKRPIVTDWNVRLNAIFVHIPKTAGTTLLEILGADPVFDTHAPAVTYRQADARLFDRAFKFTVVRNPWDRFASTFHFMKVGTDWPMQQEWADHHIGDLDFAGFVMKLRKPLFREIVLSERFFWPQHFWIEDRQGTTLVDEIYRFEDLATALPAIAARLGIKLPAAIPKRRESKRPLRSSMYNDPVMIELVGQLYAEDIARFGYRFDDVAA